jgi:D-aminoacyl-tRNA deacylase
MRLVIQRVKSASVVIDLQLYSSINTGLLVLLGIEEQDEIKDADWLIQKLVNMRLFSDDNGKMNLSLLDINGELLIVSQFTLYADVQKGNRPSFIKAARPEKAIPLYDYFIKTSETILGKPCKKGVFGADMQVSLVNDGPVTIVVDSKNN